MAGSTFAVPMFENLSERFDRAFQKIKGEATITEAKGTGVVMSVPSDSPDDYINFIQLVKKPEYRAKLGLKDEWVTSVSVVPILNIPDSDLGENSAEKLIEKLKIQGPKDADKLEEAKKEAYSEGFYKGIMTTGPFKGKKVSEAKVLMAELMTKQDEAYSYHVQRFRCDIGIATAREFARYRLLRVPFIGVLCAVVRDRHAGRREARAVPAQGPMQADFFRHQADIWQAVAA